MESYNVATVTKKIYQSGFTVFTSRTLRDILHVKKESSYYNLVKRLVRAGILSVVERDKYVRSDATIHDYTFANFFYSPSYVSCETALNYYGILSQFPHEMVSVTPKKSRRKHSGDRLFSYVHVKKELFWGYTKHEFLIAEPEKALLDQLYLATKGLKAVSIDEYDVSIIDKGKFTRYFRKFPKTRQTNSMIGFCRALHLT